MPPYVLETREAPQNAQPCLPETVDNIYGMLCEAMASAKAMNQAIFGIGCPGDGMGTPERLIDEPRCLMERLNRVQTEMRSLMNLLVEMSKRTGGWKS